MSLEKIPYSKNPKNNAWNFDKGNHCRRCKRWYPKIQLRCSECNQILAIKPRLRGSRKSDVSVRNRDNRYVY